MKMPITLGFDCRFRIADCGVTTGSIPNQQSEIRNRAACCLSLLMSVVLLTAGCSSDVPNDNENLDSGALTPVRVQAAKAERVTLRPTLDLVGTIVAIPERTAVVSPKIGGWVQELHVVEGQSVHAGDALVELDARSARTAVKRAHAVVA